MPIFIVLGNFIIRLSEVLSFHESKSGTRINPDSDIEWTPYIVVTYLDGKKDNISNVTLADVIKVINEG